METTSVRRIIFYRTESGNTPVQKFVESLAPKQSAKVVWTLNLIETRRVVDARYLKKLKGTTGIWEVRIASSGNIFRILGFFDGDDLIVLNHGFQKKTQKTPHRDIEVAEKRKTDYLRRKTT